MIDKEFVETFEINREGLVELSHALWKQKELYSRACELSEKSILNEKYFPLLLKALEEIKQINEKFIKEKMELKDK